MRKDIHLSKVGHHLVTVVYCWKSRESIWTMVDLCDKKIKSRIIYLPWVTKSHIEWQLQINVHIKSWTYIFAGDVSQTYFRLGGDPINQTQDWHSNEDPQRHQQFPRRPTPPPSRQVTTPNGGEHLLTDGMSHKLEEQKQTVSLLANCQSTSRPIRQQCGGQMNADDVHVPCVFLSSIHHSVLTIYSRFIPVWF